MVDSNNNCTVGKYSLRPRGECKKSAEDYEEDVPCESRTKTKRTSRQRSQPLSKYRRRSANARERSRMREINEAFETLRRMVSRGSENQAEKSTKISTLRLAMGYIAALSDALHGPRPGAEDGLPAEETTLEYPSIREPSRTSRCHRFESVIPSSAFKHVSSSCFSPLSVSDVDYSSSEVNSNVFLSEKVNNASCLVFEKSFNFNKQTNSKSETLRSPTDQLLQEVRLSLTADGYVSEKFSSLPKPTNNLVEEFDYEFVQNKRETVRSLDISQGSPFSPAKTFEKSSTSDFSEKIDHFSCEDTFEFKASIEKGSVLDLVEPEYEAPNSFLPVEHEVELGDIPMSHISFEELLNS